MKISSAVKIYITAIIMGGAVVVGAAGFSLYKATEVQSIWSKFDNSRSDKNRAIRALREQIGFGGMIHHFKNYLLRRNPENKEQVLLSLGGAKATLARYKLLLLNDEELNAISEIKKTLLSYEIAIDRIDGKNTEGKSAKEIDQIVRIDDSLAFNALAVLEKNIHSEKHGNEYLYYLKPHIITDIRKELGYGGMIHFYKNYILRNNSVLKDRALEKIEQTLKHIKKYSTHKLSGEEEQYINILNQNVNKYKANLDLIEGFIIKGLSPVKIDQQVKINDRPMLDALVGIERQTIIQYEKHADMLGKTIEFIVLSTLFIGGVTFIIIIIISFGSYWFVRLKVVNPITVLIDVMRKLSKGDFNVAVTGFDSENEIGDMAKSVKVFKRAVKERLEYQNELSKINSQLEERVEQRTQELKDNQKRLQAIVETAVDAIIVVDDKGVINSFNASAVNMFGYELKEVLGKNVSILVPVNERKEHDRYLSNYDSSQEGMSIIGKGREVMAVHSSGKEFPVEIALSEIFVENKRMFTGIIRDVSERYLHEEQIRRTHKMNALGKLTGGVAHDYNNMLGIILGYAELLKGKLLDNKKLHGYVAEIEKAGKRGAILTSKLLDFSQHKANNIQEVVNVNKMLLELQNMLNATLTARVELEYELGDELWNINVDKNDLENALVNMCINAMHAMNKKGALTVITENIPADKYLSNMLQIPFVDYIKISIIDTGCGMSDDIKDHIFDPFFSTKNDKGTGLGLSQVYGFVQRSQGTIKVYSEVDVGSNFSLFLPREFISDSASNSDDINVIEENEELYGSETILIVDDEPALVFLAEEILSSFGYKTFTALSAIEALDILDEEQNIDFLLSDIVMPEMDGYVLAEKVKEKYPHIIIQFASGYNAVADAKNSMNENVDVVNKPYSAQELVKKIRNLLDSKD